MEVKNKWRGFSVSIVRGLPRAFVLDEPQVTIYVRRDYLRPWRMLAALVDAMNDLAGRDDAWATKRLGSPMLAGVGVPVLLCGQPWRVTTCSVLGDVAGDGSIKLRPVVVDWDKRELRVCSRFNLGFGAEALVEAVADVCRDAAFEAFEDAQDRIHGSRKSVAAAADVSVMAAVERRELIEA